MLDARFTALNTLPGSHLGLGLYPLGGLGAGFTSLAVGCNFSEIHFAHRSPQVGHMWGQGHLSLSALVECGRLAGHWVAHPFVSPILPVHTPGCTL